MLYDPISGNRVKEPFSHITWVHVVLKQSKFEPRQCLFGDLMIIEDESQLSRFVYAISKDTAKRTAREVLMQTGQIKPMMTKAECCTKSRPRKRGGIARFCVIHIKLVHHKSIKYGNTDKVKKKVVHSC